jgi:hypothetical protein
VFTPPADDLTYSFYVEVTVDDKLYFIPSTTARAFSAILAIGRYTDSTLVAERFGPDNMHLWLANPMGGLEEPVDYAKRAWRFIDQAESMIDDAIAGPFISGPFVVEGDYVIPPTIVKLATDLAGYLMYEARGSDGLCIAGSLHESNCWWR